MLYSGLAADFRLNYNKQYEQEIYPNLDNIIQYVKQRVNQVNWNQINNRFQPLLSDFQLYYQQNKDQVKNELQTEAQRRYESDLEKYQRNLQLHTQNPNRYRRPIEPKLQIIKDDVVLTLAISNYVDNNESNLMSLLNNDQFTSNLINRGLIGEIYIKPIFNKILLLLVRGKSIQVYIDNKIEGIDDIMEEKREKYDEFGNVGKDIYDIIEIINIIQKVALPNLIPNLFNLVQNEGYQWHYFNFLNTNVPQIQAYLGISPDLNANNFEQYANIFSLDEPSSIKVSGWTRDKLLEAIFKSGLMVQQNAYKNMSNIRVDGNNVIMDRVQIKPWQVPLKPEAINKLQADGNYPESIDEVLIERNGQKYIDEYGVLLEYYGYEKAQLFYTIMTGYNLADIYANPQNYPFTIIKTYSYKYRNPQQARLNAYRLTHCLPYRSIGENKEGCIRFNVLSNHDKIDEIYRKIYGTIYTINWQNFCQSGRIKIIYLTKLQQIIDFYFNPGYDVEIKSYEQACQIIMLQLPAIQKLMQNINSPEEWSQFIRSRYNQRIIQQSKRSIQTSPSNIPSTRIKLE